eukprot:GHVP01023551.1.p3 GENE.GHVP01023551.1~~GHVP01023551.1.p3  ORF type:complete len:111 (+),score=20.30 GHVP01023551.1:222-554(+)
MKENSFQSNKKFKKNDEEHMESTSMYGAFVLSVFEDRPSKQIGVAIFNEQSNHIVLKQIVQDSNFPETLSILERWQPRKIVVAKQSSSRYKCSRIWKSKKKQKRKQHQEI